MTESPGTRGDWAPTTWPADEAAARELRDWLARSDDTELYALDLDFSGADLSGGDFTGAWVSRSRMHDTTLRNTSFARAHCEAADFSQADLTGADFVKALGRESHFWKARLRGANLTSAEFNRADFTEADLAGANLSGVLLTRSTFAHANLTGVTAEKTVLRNTILDSADVNGFTGTVIGPISVIFRGQRSLLDGADLEQWFTARGGRVTRFYADRAERAGKTEGDAT
ncbi:pentapeptide repeat-containing protein [Actinophytocola sp.]|uniref:pentapeptide repeat-containing protein n=1 Tax=Actinophytocola sp. TaxID=1872138 RepID=UPI003D6B0E03